ATAGVVLIALALPAATAGHTVADVRCTPYVPAFAPPSTATSAARLPLDPGAYASESTLTELEPVMAPLMAPVVVGAPLLLKRPGPDRVVVEIWEPPGVAQPTESSPAPWEPSKSEESASAVTVLMLAGMSCAFVAVADAPSAITVKVLPPLVERAMPSV